MIRIICPHCHASLATAELEHATLGGCVCLLCPECASVLLSESDEPETHGLAEHYPDEDFTRILSRWTLRVLRRIYRAGFGYHKAGIALLDIRPRTHQQFGLFVPDDVARSRNERLMGTLDAINGRYGRGGLRLATEGIQKAWQMRRGNLSPRYTTDWRGLAKVRAD